MKKKKQFCDKYSYPHVERHLLVKCLLTDNPHSPIRSHSGEISLSCLCERTIMIGFSANQGLIGMSFITAGSPH